MVEPIGKRPTPVHPSRIGVERDELSRSTLDAEVRALFKSTPYTIFVIFDTGETEGCAVEQWTVTVRVTTSNKLAKPVHHCVSLPYPCTVDDVAKKWNEYAPSFALRMVNASPTEKRLAALEAEVADLKLRVEKLEKNGTGGAPAETTKSLPDILKELFPPDGKPKVPDLIPALPPPEPWRKQRDTFYPHPWWETPYRVTWESTPLMVGPGTPTSAAPN